MLLRSDHQKAAFRAEAVEALKVVPDGTGGYVVAAVLRGQDTNVCLSEHVTDQGAQQRLERWITQINEACLSQETTGG